MLSLLPPFFIYASGIGLSCFLDIANQQQLPLPTLHLQQPHPIRPTNQCPVSRIRLSASGSGQLSKILMKKAHVAVGHVQTPSLASHLYRPLLSTRHDPARAKARDRSPQRSFTVLIRTMATVSSHRATRVTCGRPTILWRRAGHPPHRDIGPCLLNRMPPKTKPTRFSHQYCTQKSRPHHLVAQYPQSAQVPPHPMLPRPLPPRAAVDCSRTTLPLAQILLHQNDV